MAGEDGSVNIVAELTAKFDSFIDDTRRAADAAEKEFKRMQEAAAYVDAAVQTVTKTAKGMFDEITSEVRASADKFSDALNTAFGDGAKDAGTNAAVTFNEAFRAGLIGAAAAIGVEFLRGVQESIGEAEELAHRVKTLTVETGASTDQIQKFQYALAGVGVNGDAAQGALMRMTRAIAEAAAAHSGKSMIERMGLDPAKLKASDFDSKIGQIADALKRLKDPADRLDAAMAIFGRYSAASMLDLFSQGATGINRAEAAATALGGTLDKDVLAKFLGLKESIMQAAITARDTLAGFAAPFIDAAAGAVKYIQMIETAFQKLSDSAKTNVLIGAVFATALSFERIFAIIKTVAPGVFGELFGAVGGFLGDFNQVVLAVGALYAAWQTNFGGIRQATAEALSGVGDFLANLQDFIHGVVQSINENLLPALAQLSSALAPVFKELGGVVEAALKNKAVWQVMGAAINAVTYVLGNLILMASQVIDWLQKHDLIMKAIAVTIASMVLPAILGLIAKIILIPLALSLVDDIVVALIGRVVPGLAAIASGFLVITSLITLFGIEALYVAANWRVLSAGWLEAKSEILTGISNVIQYFAIFVRAVGDFVDKCPFIGAAMASPFEKAADAAEKAAQRIAVAGDIAHENAQDQFTEGPKIGGADSGAAWMAKMSAMMKNFKMPNFKWDTSGGGDSGLGDKSKSGAAGEAAREAVADIKDAMEPLKDALKNTEADLKELEIAMKKLGEIDAPNKLAAAQKIFNQQLATTSKELREQHALTLASHAGSEKLGRLERSTKDPKVAREYHTASRSMSDESLSSHLKELDLELKLVELKKQKNKQELDYMKLMEEGSNTYAGRVKWLEREGELLVKMGSSAKELNAVHKQILETIQKQNEASLQAAEAPLQAEAAASIRHRDLMQAGVKGAISSSESPQAKQGSVISEAQDSLADANDQVKIESLAAAAALRALQAATLDPLADDALLAERTKILADANQKLYDAQTKQLIATQDLTNAQTQLARDAAQTLNKSLSSVSDALLGPFAGAVKDIQTEIAGNMNPTTAILSSLFSVLAKDSRSFNDIQKVMTAIAEALAKSLDAIRPIIDLLLGVLTGVVNMFIGLFNIIATILNVFGLHIQKIQSVNDQLAIMGKSVPLLQITHDLPTANEYNQGKWGPLMTQEMQTQGNTLNNNLTVGFNNQLNKLGQILGELLAIKLAMMALGVAGVGGKLGAAFGGKGGPMGILSGLLSFGGGAGGSADASVGGSGSVGEAVASATWESGGAADKVLQSHVGLGGFMDKILGKHLGSGGTLSTTMTTTLATIGGGMEILKGLGKGGNMGETLGGVGAIAGTIFGGPVGGAIGQALGSIIGGMIGPKLSATKNPDIMATQQYGQGIANLIGNTQANGQNFTEDPSQSQALGGQTQGDAISAYIKKTGGAGLSAQTVQFFKDWQDGMTSLHNGVVTFKNGQSALWSDVLTMAQTAMQKVGGSISSTLQGAAALNLGTTFGNGAVSAVNGGFTVTPGAGVLAQGDSGGSGAGPSILINIEKVYGTDAATLQAAFQPITVQIADNIARAQAQRTRTQAHSVGRNQ